MTENVSLPLVTALERRGLNVVGVARVTEYDAAVAAPLRSAAVAPFAQAIIVVGSGGPNLWTAFSQALREDPTRLSREAQPLEAYVQRAVEEADTVLAAVERRWFFAATSAHPALDFRSLGQLAGLGARSRMGLLLHPEYGLWLGLRAACFIAAPLAASSRAPDFCSACAAPCVTHCPSDAMSTGTFDIAACIRFHRVSESCHRACHARSACPIGARHRYSATEVTYHYNQRAGRVHLRTLANVGDDEHDGDSPFWERPFE